MNLYRHTYKTTQVWNSIISASCAPDLCFKIPCVWSFVNIPLLAYTHLCVCRLVHVWSRLLSRPRLWLTGAPRVTRNLLIGRKMMKRRGVGGTHAWEDTKLKECGRWLRNRGRWKDKRKIEKKGSDGSWTNSCAGFSFYLNLHFHVISLFTFKKCPM